MSKNKRCTCLGCGTVWMAYTKEQAQKEVDSFNSYFNALSQKDKDKYYGERDKQFNVIPGTAKPSSIAKYSGCWCGSNQFRNYIEGDCPEGVTLSPIIWEPQ